MNKSIFYFLIIASFLQGASKKALSELLKGTGIQVPDIKNSNSK